MRDVLVKHNKRWYYKKIQEFYKGKKAIRSGLDYMNHIDEGIIILEALRAPEKAIIAYCLHPLCQADSDLVSFMSDKDMLLLCDKETLVYAMEYRNKANNFLSPHINQRTPSLSPLVEVNWMLLADKIQNYKDFLKYQSFYGPKVTMSKEKWDKLDDYFQEWLSLLLPYFKFSEDKEFKLVWELIDDMNEVEYEMVS